ncbi:MAG: inorganic phosphate transporter [Candidatus Riflebacteria bacterium]|nr:inorganic phosphate transporter [Candidatus Riflebacteria bacterium]
MDLGTWVFLIVALGVALGFEPVNGFHDTANAVATVIYTNSLKPNKAVVWSGLCNFVGVYLGGVSVAFSIVYLLPVDLLISIGSGGGMAMVLALLTAAILWNLGTWYMAIPSSSSHALIGAILGVGLASSLGSGREFGSGVNWTKAGEVGLALLLSPILGFCASALLLWLTRVFLSDPTLHEPPRGEKPPPPGIRGALLLTCTGISLAHGSNDGQKGIGLIMLILIGILPSRFALNLDCTAEQVKDATAASARAEVVLRHDPVDTFPLPMVSSMPTMGTLGGAFLNAVRGANGPAWFGWGGEGSPSTPFETAGISVPDAATVYRDLAFVRGALANESNLRNLSEKQRWEIRNCILRLNYALLKLERTSGTLLGPHDVQTLREVRLRLRVLTDYSPTWVLIAVALALAIGTMLGWKRIVVTVGEKIGKAHMTYAQGASAGLVAMSAIGLAAACGLPVSTTHVLASGVAGTMSAQGAGLQGDTVKKIAMAWILTLPVCIVLSGLLFQLFLRLAS